jgi:hypothetical protein
MRLIIWLISPDSSKRTACSKAVYPIAVTFNLYARQLSACHNLLPLLRDGVETVLQDLNGCGINAFPRRLVEDASVEAAHVHVLHAGAGTAGDARRLGGRRRGDDEKYKCRDEYVMVHMHG